MRIMYTYVYANPQVTTLEERAPHKTCPRQSIPFEIFTRASKDECDTFPTIHILDRFLQTFTCSAVP